MAAGRYIETFKLYENKSADALQGGKPEDYLSRLRGALTTVKSVNKTDTVGLPLLNTHGLNDVSFTVPPFQASPSALTRPLQLSVFLLLCLAPSCLSTLRIPASHPWYLSRRHRSHSSRHLARSEESPRPLSMISGCALGLAKARLRNCARCSINRLIRAARARLTP